MYMQDGTTNFVHRFPFVCVCIGLAIHKKVRICKQSQICTLCGSYQSPCNRMCVEKLFCLWPMSLLMIKHSGALLLVQVVVGVVYNPILEELYTAVRGKGSYLNGEQIHTSPCKELGSALIISEVGVTRDDATLAALFGRMTSLVKEVNVTRFIC
jgi:inositol-phosphate phosphatase/L-galactose 1-phosphate phosphatase